MRWMAALSCLAALLLANPAAAQPTPPTPEDCGCGVPDSPRGPR